MRWVLAQVGLTVVVMGCASTNVERPAPPASNDWDAAEQSALTTSSTTSAPSKTLSVAPPPSLRETQRIGGAEPPPPVRPVRKKRIDVHLHGAPAVEAFRFLAKAGGFNVIVDGSWSAPVTADLRDVDAFDALVLLAEAHGGHVRYDRNVAVVSDKGVDRDN